MRKGKDIKQFEQLLGLKSAETCLKTLISAYFVPKKCSNEG